MRCRMCDTDLIKFLDLGQQPPANEYLWKGQINSVMYKLEVGFCPCCHLVQIFDCPSYFNVFDHSYPFLTSTSKYMENHFKHLADTIKRKYLSSDYSIIEIGCNDGTFLKNFKNHKHLGIEPSSNVANVARDKGLDVLDKYFDDSTAVHIISHFGKADVIVSANVFPHIPTRESVLKGIKKVLKPEGIWINEEPYLGSIISNVAYDQFYNEHIFYSSVESFKECINTADLDLFNFSFHKVHGGSMRYYVSHSDNVLARQRVKNFIKLENLSNIGVFNRFGEAIECSKYKLLSEIYFIKSCGGNIVGYGATAKSSTMLNYCKIGPSLITKIYDTTPDKQNKFSPGMRIPIVPYEQFDIDKPDNVILFAWNHAKEIYEKEKGKTINWIMPI